MVLLVAALLRRTANYPVNTQVKLVPGWNVCAQRVALRERNNELLDGSDAQTIRGSGTNASARSM